MRTGGTRLSVPHRIRRRLTGTGHGSTSTPEPHDADGVCRGDSLVEQFERALANVVRALEAAGGSPEHLVSVQRRTTDVAAYRAAARELGGLYRRAVGRHYPAMALFEVSALFDPDALVELVSTAVLPEAG